jgi:hypothetical protein
MKSLTVIALTVLAQVMILTNTYAGISEEKIKPSLENYLCARIAATGFGGQPFCTYKLIESDENDTGATLYIWIHCQEYFSSAVKEGTEVSLPAMVELIRDGVDYRIVSFKTVSTDFRNNIRDIFPESVLKKIFPQKNDYSVYNSVILELKEENHEKAKDFFNNYSK